MNNAIIKFGLMVFAQIFLVTLVFASCPDVCLDFDDDGYGNPASGACAFNEYDCDDSDPVVKSGSLENTAAGNCRDGSDNDCDGRTDCADEDCWSDKQCLTPLPVCGDGSCNGFEDCISCWGDCSSLNNGVCDIACGECPLGIHENFAECGCGNGSVECGEMCDDGNKVDGDGCDSNCQKEAIVVPCIDNDNDGYDAYDPVDCATGNDCNDLNPAINPGVSEKCDTIDWNCNNDPVDGFVYENCDSACGLANFVWTGSGGLLNCCGNNPGEASPYELTENTCDGVSDNDCDGMPDASDPDCTGICNNTGENDWVNALSPGDCNQCDFEGDNDGDQTTHGEDWSLHPGMVDRCDSDCGIVAVSVDLNNFQSLELSCDGIDNDCDGEIDEGCSNDIFCVFPTSFPCKFQ